MCGSQCTCVRGVKSEQDSDNNMHRATRYISWRNPVRCSADCGHRSSWPSIFGDTAGPGTCMVVLLLLHAPGTMSCSDLAKVASSQEYLQVLLIDRPQRPLVDSCTVAPLFHLRSLQCHLLEEHDVPTNHACIYICLCKLPCFFNQTHIPRSFVVSRVIDAPCLRVLVSLGSRDSD